MNKVNAAAKVAPQAPARPVKDRVWNLLEWMLASSLRSAVDEQGLAPLVRRLEEILPDIGDHYSTFSLSNERLRLATRAQMAFQMALATPEFESRTSGTIVDIGDSSGAHIHYLKNLFPKARLRFLSVNLDEEAVKRIQRRGYEAVCARAEDLLEHDIRADIFLCFETLEHLSDPITFLHELASHSECERLIITVPYVRQSRVGMQYVRNQTRRPVTAETVHRFELSPEDWKLIFRHSGWSVRSERVFLQYPRFSPWRLAKPLWKKFDFEGFYGVVLTRDDSWSSLYRSW